MSYVINVIPNMLKISIQVFNLLYDELLPFKTHLTFTPQTQSVPFVPLTISSPCLFLSYCKVLDQHKWIRLYAASQKSGSEKLPIFRLRDITSFSLKQLTAPTEQ